MGATHPGHLVPEFQLGAQVPDHGDDADHYATHNGGVGLPVGGLRIPSTGG